MKLLAIDTSTEACSAAVLAGNRVCERYEIAPRRHAELILPMCEAVLHEAGLALADLDGLAFGRGPGAFTGLRIAAGVIQGLALATGVKVAGVSSLAAMALGATRVQGAARVYAAIDARIGEVYCAAFECAGEEGLREVVTERVCAPEAVPILDSAGWTGVGSGFAAHGERLRQRLGRCLGAVFAEVYPRAGDVALLGASMFSRGLAVTAEQAQPVYLRDKVAEIPPSRRPTG